MSAGRAAPRWSLSTPPGQAAVAVIRIENVAHGDGLCGFTFHALGAGTTQPADGCDQPSRVRGRRDWPGSGRVAFGELRWQGQRLDEILAVGGPSGCEWHLHGGRGVVAAVARRLQQAGLERRPAPPPPDVSTWRQARAWLSLESGPLALLLSRARSALRTGGIDTRLRGQVERSLALAALARRLESPPLVRLVGRPNAGKSTLFNALLGCHRALVSPRAGTTRDAVSARWRLRDVPIELEDTAGIAVDRPGGGHAGGEEGGAPGGADGERRADLLVVLDADSGRDARPAAERSLRVTDGEAAGAILRVSGKADLGSRESTGLAVSGLTGQGLAGLADAIAGVLGIPPPGAERLLAPMGTVARQCLAEAGRLPPTRVAG